MFEAARNFVIQNGVFIDVSGNAKLYAKKLLPTSSREPRYTGKSKSSADKLYPYNALLLNYRQFRMGDIHVLDGIVHKHKVYDDVVVEVTGETKKRAARIYYGQHGHSQLRLELQLLSKLYPHPRIRQIFGIFKCNDTTGLVFHDDGTHQRHRDYMVSLQPLQRATFSIKYVNYIVSYIVYSENLFRIYQLVSFRIPSSIYAGTLNHFQLRSGFIKIFQLLELGLCVTN
ncbi:hypothetical protein BDQ17DRAFT_477373 [Cyathus striatus]|nr:hypothetical protein BDQ17DRAFT_477373 [Cyathus striatus]